jgi:hypothetical protein
MHISSIIRASLLALGLILRMVAGPETGYAQTATQIAPDHPDIVYTGRWDDSDLLQPWAHWKGSSIIAYFQGTSLDATFSAGNSDYLRVIIDDDADSSTKLAVSSSATTYMLATDLSNTAVHKIEIVKETDVGK